MKRVGAVIAAAGLSSRMGEFKALLPFGDMSIAGHLVSMLLKSGISPIVMVTGYRGEELERELSGNGIWFVKNQKYAFTQMIDSLKIGLETIRSHCGQALVMPVDVPAVTEETVRRVIETDGPIVRTRCRSRCGHPVKLDDRMMEEAIAYQGEEGLKGFIAGRQDQVMEIEVYDEGSFLDADTRKEYRQLLELNGARGQGYPDGAALRWLMEISKMPDTVRRHGEAVSIKALTMAAQLQKAGITLDTGLVRSSALLHDIGKGSPDHACYGAGILRGSGYSLASEIVRQHHDLDRLPPTADETLVVYLADKMMRGEHEVTIRERFEKSRTKCAGSTQSLINHERRYRQALAAWKVWEQSVGQQA